jgi:large subunit ribosomal protein L31e
MKHMVKLERIYTVPLGEAYEQSRRKRVPRAVKILRTFIGRHMKADGERILLSESLNKYLWVKSIQKPPRRVKVRLIKDDGVIRAFLSDEKVEELKKKDAPKAEGKKEEKKAEEKPAAKAEKKEEKPASKPEGKK